MGPLLDDTVVLNKWGLYLNFIKTLVYGHCSFYLITS